MLGGNDPINPVGLALGFYVLSTNSSLHVVWDILDTVQSNVTSMLLIHSVVPLSPSHRHLSTDFSDEGRIYLCET